jgi:hypothetical protein
MTAITVAAMIEALSALPPDAELVVTESGYYCYGEFATIMLPEAYTVEGAGMDGAVADEDVGRVVYRIGHSHQSY